MKPALHCLVSLLSLATLPCEAAYVHAHPLFQEHAVLQRDQPIRVWGTAGKGERVTVKLASSTTTVRADDQGAWSASLPAMPAGGPYSMEIRGAGGAAQTIDDVMVGDVWLCSGQSNMVLQVHRALDARAEIANSANERIRLLTVPQASNARPQSDFGGSVQWQVAGPATVRDFSAACLYFARELQKTVDVPLGLIASAWGGSKIQTWMSDRALRATGRYDAGLDVLALYPEHAFAALADWGAAWEQWWRARTAGSAPWESKPSGRWSNAPSGLGHWETWGVPELASYNGMLWYRTSVKLSAQQAAQSATLSLGLVDEVEQTWINSRPIGAGVDRNARAAGASVVGPGPERTYQLPPKALRAGVNDIVVNVLDTYGAGGLHGPPQSRWLRLGDGQAIALDGEWRYQIPPAGVGMPPRAPWESVAGLGVIYNGMIAPLGDLALRGVLWYQGESNTDESSSYQDLLRRFMADWRSRFGAALPFLIVQLANYGPPPTAPGESGWAELREAQRLAVAQDERAGLAVAIDIGDRYDIHPANKQEVGRRLARAARHVAYGEKISPSGPIPLTAHREGTSIVVKFADVSDRLATYSAQEPIGFELCGDSPGSCAYARADIAKDSVALDAGAHPAPKKVRYCWADSPVCTLFDAAGLPAGPFQLEVN